MTRLLRTLAFVAFAMTVWLVSAPANAATYVPMMGAAGLCSQNGSSEVAPPPLMIPAQASLEQGDLDMCFEEWTGHSVQRGEDRNELTRSVAAEAVLPRTVVVPRASRVVVLALTYELAASNGVRFGLERPPRSVA